MKVKIGSIALFSTALVLFASCHEMQSSVEIQAPAAVVWQEFSDFASYPDWNPFLVHQDGNPAVGSEIRIDVRSESGRTRELHPVVRTLEKERVLEWESITYLPLIFTERYRFELKPVPGKESTLFIQTESFRGILVPLFQFAPLLKSSLRMNDALKSRAERHEREENGDKSP